MLDQLDDIDALHGEGYKMPTRHDAEEAVRILLSYLEGKEFSQGGLLKTPKRVMDYGTRYFQATTQAEDILTADFNAEGMTVLYC